MKRVPQGRPFAIQGVARVEVSTKSLNDRNGRVVATQVFTGESPVDRDEAANVVAAVDAALNQVLVELVGWTVGKL